MKTKAKPMRRCVGCMESKEKNELIRVAGYEGEITIDPTGKAKGRGVYLCPKTECFENAQKRKAIGRNLEMDLKPEQLIKLFEELKKYEK